MPASGFWGGGRNSGPASTVLVSYRCRHCGSVELTVEDFGGWKESLRPNWRRLPGSRSTPLHHVTEGWNVGFSKDGQILLS